MNKILLLDGHSIAYRAYYALPETMKTKSGQQTNAVYGFTSMLLRLMKDERPSNVVACFDCGVPQFRLDLYHDYKGNRRSSEKKPVSESIHQQITIIKQVLEAMSVPIVEMKGYEADDLLATLSVKANKDDKVLIVTGDRDMLQLVRKNVYVIMLRRGVTDTIRYKKSVVVKRYGVKPVRWTDFAALKGEPSDNLPGVPGVGDKTAAALIQEYGDIEKVIVGVRSVKSKVAKSITHHSEQVRMNKQLGTLLKNAPVIIDRSQALLCNPRAIRNLFVSLEFNSLIDRINNLRRKKP